MGKGEIPCDEQFFPFPGVFSTNKENFLPFSSNLKLWPANLKFGSVENLSFGKELTDLITENKQKLQNLVKQFC